VAWPVLATAFVVLFSAGHVVGQEKKEEPADKELESLIRDLRSKDIGTRVNAVKKLAEKGEDAAPAARALCDAIGDSSPRVGMAALEAVEKVRPDLYKPLATMIVDEDERKQTRAIEELGLMGEKAAPCLGVIVTKLRKELAGRRGVFHRSTVDACFKAIRQIKPDMEAIKFLKLVAGSSTWGPSRRDAEPRLAAIVLLDEWTEGDEAKRKAILPLVKGALDDKDCCIVCIRILGSYGRLAKDAVPQLKKLKLSSEEEVRDAAAAAIEKIESQPPDDQKEERPKGAGAGRAKDDLSPRRAPQSGQDVELAKSSLSTAR
jgi:HEAT repeat protein